MPNEIDWPAMRAALACDRIAVVAVALAERMGESDEDLLALRAAARTGAQNPAGPMARYLDMARTWESLRALKPDAEPDRLVAELTERLALDGPMREALAHVLSLVQPLDLREH